MGVYFKSELPSEYQEVEYVESSGTQYIKTGLNICDGYRHTQKIRFLTTQSNSYIISGGYLGEPVTMTFMRFYFCGPQSNGQWSWGYLGNAPGQPGHQTGGSGGSANVDYNLDICWISGNAYYKVNDTTLMSNSSTWTTSLAGECTLFGGYAEDSNPHYIPYPGGVRIYDSKFYNASGTLVRDFIPCYRKSDNVIGMYDLVTNQFYTNAGTGTFTKGSDVLEHELKNAYVGEYHEFNGDLSKAISSNRTSFTVSAYSYEVKLSTDGTKMFIGWNSPDYVGSPDGVIAQYTLTTPFDITTATNRTDYGVGILRDYPNPCFADNGMKLFVGKGNNTTYARYDLINPYDLSTVDFSNPDATFTMTADLAIQSVSADGKSFIYRPGSSRNLSYAVSTTARSPVNSQTNLISSSNVVSGEFCNEGKMLMMIDGGNLKKYEFGTPYDLTTLNTTPIQTQSTGLSGNPWGIYVDKHGDNIYFIMGNTTVYRYNLV